MNPLNLTAHFIRIPKKFVVCECLSNACNINGFTQHFRKSNISFWCVEFLALLDNMNMDIRPYLFGCSLQDRTEPIMCSYKAVKVFFEVWGLQTKVESAVHKVSVCIMHEHGHSVSIAQMVFFTFIL